MYTQNVSQTIVGTRYGFLNRAVRSRPATDKTDSRSGTLALPVRREHSTFFSTFVMAHTTLSINVPMSLSTSILLLLILITKSTSYPTLTLLAVLSPPLAYPNPAKCHKGKIFTKDAEEMTLIRNLKRWSLRVHSVLRQRRNSDSPRWRYVPRPHSPRATS